MRKLILQMQVSVDGYVGQAKRDPSWQLWDWGDKCPWDEKLQKEFNQFFVEADTILLSRKIVEGGYIDHWTETAKKHPRSATFAFAQRILAARKIIFSKTLKTSPRPEAELAEKPLVETVDDLKSQNGKNIVAFGGAGFASELIANDLVDEFQFYTNPIALHEGLSIFAKKGIDQDLELIDANAYSCGIVVAKYAPRGRA
jgi:dihydrofolate reductase